MLADKLPVGLIIIIAIYHVFTFIPAVCVYLVATDMNKLRGEHFSQLLQDAFYYAKHFRITDV